MPKSRKIILSTIALFGILSGGSFWYFHKYDTRDYEHRGFFPLPILKPEWERKIITGQVLKIGLITDTHIHPNRIDRNNKADDAPRILNEKDVDVFNKFNRQMEKFEPEILIHLGDIIEGTNDEDFVGIMGLELAMEEMKKIGLPVYALIGNHELRSVTKDQFKEVMQADDLNYIVDKGDYRLIFLDANYDAEGNDIIPGKHYLQGHLPENILIWLEESLKTDKRVFVFMHQAAFDRDMPGEEGRMKLSIDNAEVLRGVLEKYNAEAIFSGHIEVKFYEEKDGVRYYSLPGTKKSKLYLQSYYEITIDGAEPDVAMFYTEKESGEEKIIDF
ncbi:MAG: metallophosphoesterase [Candidatus Moranbacteria bacterium]|nr:metallophosphoesterase [Candidatus Moranbacteria bacterium]